MGILLSKLHYRPGQPHPFSRWFLVCSIVVIVISLPILIIASISYQGYELVPSLQPQFKPNVTTAGWWTSAHLPTLLPSKIGPCEPQSLGRGDTFRLSGSLFDYTVKSTWNTKDLPSASQIQDQQRAEYRGESFANCTVNGAQFDFNMEDSTQTVTVGVACPGSDAYPVYVSMETTMVFAWILSKDFVGQYYGPGLDLLNINDTNPYNYRKLAFAALEAISTDSLTIMRGQHLSSRVSTISVDFNVSLIDGVIQSDPMSNTFTYLNGTQLDWPAEAGIYLDSIYNLVHVAAHTVNLDLGSAGSENIYKNFSALNNTIRPNLAPPGIRPANWAENAKSFYYGVVPPPYQTWAQTMLAGKVIPLGTVTDLPTESSMVISYLCPSYQLKPIRTLLMSMFIATYSMFQTVWVGWIVILALIASRVKRHCDDCECSRCKPKYQGCKCGKCGDNQAHDIEGQVGKDAEKGMGKNTVKDAGKEKEGDIKGDAKKVWEAGKTLVEAGENDVEKLSYNGGGDSDAGDHTSLN